MNRISRRRVLAGGLAAGGVSMLRPRAARAASKIRVVTNWFAEPEHGGLYHAVEAGFYEKAGLDVELKQGGPQLNSMQLLAGGEADVIMSYDIQIMSAYEKGVPVKAFFTCFQFDLIGLLTRPDVSSLADLKGRKIAITGAGTLTGWITRELVKSQGWSDSDITYVTSTNIAASRALLKVGELDAITTDLSTTLEQQRKGEESLLFSYGDLVKDFHMQIIFATDKVIAEKPNAVAAFMAAWLETIAFVKANKAKTVETVQQVLGFHPDVLNETYDRVVSTYSTDGRFNPRALAVLARSYVELKLLDKEPDMTKLTTEAFLPKK